MGTLLAVKRKMKVEVPFEEICHVLKKLVAKQQEGHKKLVFGIPNPKDAAIKALVNTLAIKSTAHDQLEVTLPVGSLTLSDIKVADNNITFSTSGGIDFLIGLAKPWVEQYVRQEGGGKMSVLLSELPQATPVFDWVNLESISFQNNNVILNIATV